MKRILLVRHGRTEANDRWLYCGSTDLPLSPTGRQELQRKKPMAEAMGPTGFEVYISPMLRAKETLSILWGLEGTEVPALREMDFGIFEMKSYADLKDTAAFQRWCEGDNGKNVCPGGESGEQMTHRVIEAFQQITAGEENALLVFHGGPIAAVMEWLFPGEGKNRYEWQPKNGAGYEIFMDENRPLCYHTILE